MADDNQQKQKGGGQQQKLGLNFASGIDINRSTDNDVVSAGINGLAAAIGFGFGAVTTVLSFFGIKRSKNVGRFVAWLTKGKVDLNDPKPQQSNSSGGSGSLYDIDRKGLNALVQADPQKALGFLKGLEKQINYAAGVQDNGQKDSDEKVEA